MSMDRVSSPLRFSGPVRPRQRRVRLPAWLCLVAIGLAAWLYLAQSDRASAASAQLQQQQQIAGQLTAQRQSALAALGAVESPAYTLSHARLLGFVPGSWGDGQ